MEKEEKIQNFCIDFDGVLAYHESDWPPEKIGEPLSPGITLAKKVKECGFRLVILTAREPQYFEAISKFLAENGVRPDEITNVKPPSYAYVDDRAIPWARNRRSWL